MTYRGPDVFYNWGRWKVQCPSPDCLGVEEVRPGKRLAVCTCRDPQMGGGICTHGPVCGTLIRLAWPENPREIEDACVGRPVQNRNWHPGETLEDLEAENLIHGVV